jgi:gliding motility-associated-like protein
MRIKNYLLSVLILLCSYNITAQVVTPFTPRLAGGNLKLKGDIIFVGNNIVNRTTTNPTYDAANNVTNQAVLTAEANTPYNGGLANNNFNFDYIDIDGDPTTFSSSTADLNIIVPCKKIIYAGLYWTATYPFERIKSNGTITIPRQNDWNQVKFKLPGGAYQTLVADNAADPVGQEDDIIVDNNTSNTNGVYGVPYVCYKNVTSLLQGLADANGTYGVANQRGQLGKYTNTGSSAGWSIVIVYESPSLPSKYISIFDGYANVDGSSNVDFNVNGFVTLPPPFPVRARIGVGALEGDLEYTGDNLRFKANSVGGFTTITNGLNPNNNFFNSSITNNNVAITNRNINSSNTLGFDLDLVQVNNPLNAVVPNNETGATLRLTTNGDAYGAYLATFDVEIIEPKIILTKTVADLSGADVGGQNVTLCQPLNYTIGFQNIGNDDADFFTIKDILPPNVSFNPASVVLPTPPVTVPATPPITFTYNAGTRTIIFTIPKGFVTINAPRYTIQLGVKVLCTCLELDDACSNLITNQAFATYQGVINTAQITDDPSLSSYTVCNLSGASPTNTLVGLDACNFTQDVVLCGTTVTLTAAGGYTTYTWSGPPGATITPVAGTNNQSVVVNQVGTYTVNNLITTTPCKSIVQTINVVDITGTPPLTNPVLPYADQIVICPNDGKQLPLIFLCGAADSQLIATTITGATSISWEQLNTASCAAVVNPNCANENPACTWTVVGTGLNYTANTAGQFRVVINYPGGCSRIFYFNVFQNLLNPIATPRDAVCSTPGQITITGVPAGYEYSLDCSGTWQASNVFTPVPVGVHSVCIRQTGITGGCVFTLTNIPIVNRVFTVSAILTQPICSGDKGSINLAANNVLPQYTFTINQGATLISTFGPTNSSSTVFNNLTPGNYTYTVTTQDGCSVTTPFTIIQPPLLTITAALTKPLTCGPGEITVYPVGGTPPYNFNVTGAVTVTQSSPIISAPVAGTYNIQVVDNNNCTANVSITVALVPPPVYTVTQTNVLCYGSNTGAINFNVTNANGFTLQYSIDGITFFPTPNFPNLVAGTYTIIVRYTLGTAVCLTTPVTITITQPAAALTASAGVSELAGCGPLGEGRVRIINPQGGVPAYTYSFDNGATYTGVNQAYLLPGTYTVYIKDANGCIFPMTVTLDPAPAAPTIVVTPPVFACNGNATSTVTVNNNGGSFSYTYLLDGVPNTPPTNNVFSPVTCGPHTVTVNYQATNIPTPSNLLFEDFGIGANTTTPGIAAAYCFNPQAYPAGQPCGNAVAGFPASACGTWFLNDNQYVVTPLLNPNNCAWFPYRDHTSNGTNPKGRFLAVNIGSAAGPNGVLYSKTINNVLPNQPVIVDIYLANLLTVGNGGADPSFILELVDGSGTVIASQSTGIIDNTVNAWQLKSLTLNPGANTTLTFKIRSGSIIYGGNDAAIDDINVYQQPIACITTKNFPINIACNQAFTAQVTGSNNVSCNGGNNGTITISAQNFGAAGFQYSTNGGATWTTSLVSPVTISGLTATTYNIQIRYDSNPANTACSFPFTTIITQPAVLTPSVIVTPATCLTGATITASAVGGTPAYQYQLQTSLGAVIVTAYQASGTFTNVATGNYVVLVRDANLCVSTSIPVSVVAATPPTATISAASNFCYSSPAGATIVVTAAGGVAPYAYNINGGAFQVSNTFPNLTPGSYTIIVRDAYGCTVTLPVQTIAPQLTLSTVLTKDLDCTASPNAVITGTIAGGYSGYTYQVRILPSAVFTNLGAVPAAPGNVFTYTAGAGSYQFQVTDTRGCTAQSGVITINPIVNPTATTAVTNVTCNGLSNGSVIITPSLGIAPYVIQWNGTGPFTSTITYSSLAAGTYTYIVRDSKSCTFNGSVTIGQPATITGIATLTTQYTCTTSGVITVSGVSGGTSPYTYSISGLAGPFQAGTTFTITAAGTYIITIKDLAGCTFATTPIIVTPNTPPTDLTFVATALTCPTNVSTVTLTATGGSPVLNYQITAPAGSATAYQASNVFSNLAPGTYTFQVRDGRNCTYQESYTIAPLPVLTVTGSVVNNVRCFGTATGSATFTVGGFAPNYNYVITGPVPSSGTAQVATTINIASLLVGTYTIVITNPTTNCTATTSVTITQPATALAVTLTPSPVTCLINGQVVVNAVGGWGGNVYTISPVAGTLSGNTFSNLPAGSYTVTTTDAGGCAVTANFTLVAPTPPTATISAASNFCYSTPAGATIVVTAAGGVTPYSYNINGGAFQASNTFPNLTPGSYTIIVRDAFGCTVTLPVQTIAPQLTLSAVLTKDLDCTASPNAVITGTIAGGYPGYTYQVRILPSAVFTNLGAVPAAPGNVFTYTAGAGSYQFQVTDTRGCIAQSGIFTVNPLIPVAATHTQTNNLCFGDTAGTVTITPSGGVGPYQVNFNGLGLSSTFTYSGLAAGTYPYIVRDSKSCTFNGSVTITQPAKIAYTAIVNPITCSAGIPPYTLGSICVNALTGGVAPYTYTLVDLTGGTATQTHIEPLGANYCFTNIDFGLYDLSVTDANGCTIVKSNLVMASPPGGLTFTITSIASCASGASLTATISGGITGSGPYQFGIVDSTISPYSCCFFNANPGPPPFYTFTGLIPGATYTIVVRDVSTNCYYFETAPATNTNSTLTATVTPKNVSCRGAADGSLSFSLAGMGAGVTQFTYQIINSVTNLPFGGLITINAPFAFPYTTALLPVGTYSILVREINGANGGCGKTFGPFTISQSATDLILSATTSNDNCNVNAGQINPTVSGGTGPYTFQYLTAGFLPVPTAGSPGWVATNIFNGEGGPIVGNYDVYVKDANGCIKKITVNIGLDPTPSITANLVNACVAQGTYQINVTMPTAGIAPYTFSVDGGAFVANTTPFTISGLSSGTHTIQVKDKNGCGNTVSVTILTPLIVSAVFTTQPTCFNNNGTITASASGGSAPANYTYTLLTSGSVIIVGPQGSNVFAGQPAGCYIIRVTDSTTGCSVNTPFCLTLPTPVTFTAVPTSVTCNGGTDGTITINLTGLSDNPPYTYQINAPIVVGPQASNIFTGLAAGTYTVQVNSGRGCTLIDNNVIVGTPTPVVASASATPFTCAANNSVNVSLLSVFGAGGTPAYTYSINGVNYFATSNFNIINTGAVQNITVYVKDSKGCIDTDVIIINPLPAITAATVTQTIAITCTNPELVTITVTGGSGNFTYQTLPLGAANVTQVGATNQFNISAPGTYFFQVNDVTTGCYFATLAYTVAPYNTIDVVATATTPVSCFGSNNGAISINVTGYTGAYSYNVLDSASATIASGVGNTTTNPLLISGLAAGNYTVQVTETASPFCVKISNVVTVASPSQVALSLASNINANCNSGAQVTVIGSGGTPAYTYAFVQNGFIPVLADYTASNTAVLNPATNTQWDVYVKDANGCFTFIDVTIATDVMPTVILPTFASDQCTSTGTSYTFTATGTGLAPLTYSIGAGFQSSGTFTVSAPGVYTVTIKDKNGCTASASITVYPPIGVNPSITALPSCANNDGSITVNTVGGSGTYNYSIAPNPAGITLVGNVFSNVPSGIYTITVTDVLTTCTKNVSVTLSAATPVTFTAVPTNVSCSGGTDGTITVNLAAGNNNPVYTYQITAGPVTTAVQTANVFTGLPTGTYTIQVISGRGCQLIDNNVIVGTPNPIVVPATTITQFGCAAGTNAVNLATITVTGVTGGSGVYTNYEFILGGVIQQSGSSNTYSTANVVGGTYTINVFDNKGCLGTTTAVINPYISISNPTVVVNNPITCTTNEQITISVTTAGGVPPVFSYTVTGYPTNAIPYNVTQNSPTFTGLTIGDYLITVLNAVTGCSVQTIHYVNNPNTFDLLLNNVVDVTCFGGNNGSVNITIVDNDLTPTNDAGPFNYTILNSLGAPVTSGSSATAGPITISGLPSGIYTANVSLIATPFCTVTKNFTISGPTSALGISATSSPITCITGNNDGTITASATGGWGAPYEFQLQIGAAIVGTYSYSANANFTGLTQATYTVYVKDVRGCITSTNVTLTNPLPINAVITSSGPTVACFGDCNATISISYPTGGQGSNYSYVLHSTIPTVSDSGPIAIPLGGIVLTGLCADTYTVTITDGFDCSFTSANIVIAQPAKVVASLSTATTQTCLTQATLTLTGSGGTPPYSYSTTGIAGSFIGSFNPSIIIPVPVGTYHYYIQDANGCNSLVSGDVIITPLDPLTISSLSHQDILCGGSSTGTISATATGGLLNYVYTLLDGAGNPILPAPTQTTPGNFSNLPAGTYIVHVQSLDCPKDSPSIIITEPTPFNVAYTPIPVKCNGGNDGAVNLVITGGTGAIQYAISPNLSQFITITNPYVAGGFNVPNLASGSYTLIIQDQNGCFVTFNNITINQPTALTSNITSFVDEDCAELDLGEITVGGIGGGTAPYSVTYTVVYPGSTTVVTSPIIALAAGVTTYNFTGLNGGNYTTIVIDGNGCKSENQQLLGSGVLYDPRAEVTYPCVNNSPAVRVEVLNLSNTPSLAFTPLSDYLFSLDVNSSVSAQASNIFTSAAYPSLLIPGVPHTIYVFHANGCDKATNSFTINATDIDPLNLSLTQVFLNQLVATLNPVTGGTAPYTYTFQDETGATVQNGPNNIHIYDHTATYTVTVTDSKGCTDTATKAVVFIPIKIDNVYTPGDGSGWGPKNTSNYPDIVTYIYDRYGRKVAELLEGQKWYGKYNGQELPSGDYWYVIKVDAGNDSEYVGHFTLYR